MKAQTAWAGPGFLLVLGLLLLVSAPSAQAATLTGVDVAPTSGDYRSGEVETWRFRFTTVNAVPAGGDVRIVFPAGFTLNTVTTDCSLDGSDLTAAVAGSEVICGLPLGLLAATAYTLDITNVQNPTYAHTAEDFVLQTRNTPLLLSAVIDSHTTNDETIVPNALGVTSVSAPLRTAGAIEEWTFQITTVNALSTNEHVRVVFPSGFVTGTATCSITAPATVLTTAVEYGSGTDVRCKITGGSVAAATAMTVKFQGVTNPTIEQTTGAFTIQTRRSTNEVRDEHLAQTVSITAASIAGLTIDAPQKKAGQTETYTVTFTTINPVASDGNVRIVFPTGYALSAGGTTKCRFGGADLVTSTSGTAVVCSLGSALNGATSYAFDVTLVKNPPTSGTTGAFTVQTRTSTNAVHDQHTTATVSLVANALGVSSASSATQKTGATETWTFQVTTINPATGDVRVVFPAGFVASGSQCTIAGGAPFAATVASSTEVLCSLASQPFAAATSYTFTISGVRNPVLVGTTGAFTVQTRTGGAANDEHLTNTETITASTLVDLLMSAPLQTTSTVETWSVSFKPVSPVANTGEVRVVFPSGFQTSSGAASVCDITTETGDDYVVVSSTEIRCRLNGGGSFAAGESVTLTISNVRSPTSTGATGVFTVQTRDQSFVVHDEHLTNTEVIAGAGLSLVSVAAPNQKAGATETWTFTFTTSTAVATGGDVRIVFPSGFTTTSGSTACDVASKTGETTSLVGTTELVCNLNTLSLTASESVTVSVTNVKNPTVSGTTGAFTIQVRDALDAAVDNHLTNVETIVPNVLGSVGFSAPGQYVARSETWTASFVATNPVAASGDIRIVFPAGFQTSYPSTSVCDVAGRSGETTVIASTTEVVCELGASNQISAGESVSLTITNIRNPLAAQTAGPFGLYTRSAANVVHDEHLTNVENVVAASLSGFRLSAPRQGAGMVEVWTGSFVTASALEAGGDLRVVLPSGFIASSSTVCDLVGKSGEFTTVVSATEIVCNLGAVQLAAGETVTFALSNVQNPSTSRITTAPSLHIRDGADLVREQHLGSSLTIVVASFGTNPTVQPTLPAAGQRTDLVVNFTTTITWPGSGKLRIVLPAGYGVHDEGPSSTRVTYAVGVVGGFAAPTQTGLTLTFAREAGVDAPAGTRVTLILSALRNPTTTTSGAFGLTLLDASGAEIMQGSAASVAMLGGVDPTPSLPPPPLNETVNDTSLPPASAAPDPTPAGPIPIRIEVAPTAPFVGVILAAFVGLALARRRA